MSPARTVLPQALKRAVIVSACIHVGLIVLIAASPSLTRSPRRGLVQYVNFMGGSGGTGGGTPGGGGPAPKAAAAPAEKKPALRDLTVPSKLEAEPKSAMTHPVDKPKTAKKGPEKQAAIAKPEPAAPSTAAGAVNPAGAGATSGSGYGLRFGTGAGGSGGGTGLVALGGEVGLELEGLHGYQERVRSTFYAKLRKK